MATGITDKISYQTLSRLNTKTLEIMYFKTTE